MHDKDPQVAVMASTRPGKYLEPGLLSSRVIDEKVHPSLYHHAWCPSLSVDSSRPRSYWSWDSDRMTFFRRLTFTILIITLLTVAYASVPVRRGPEESLNAVKETSFQDLLNSVSDASLHKVLLNVYEKYKYGVFREARTAIQAVHDENAAVATSLVELARRQNPNITSVTVPASSIATVVIVPTTETDTVVQTSGSDTVVVVNTQTTATPVTSFQPTSPAGTPVQTTAPQVSSNPPSETPSSVSIPVQSSAPVQSVNSSPPPGSSTPAPTSPSPSPSSQANPTSQAPPSSPSAPAQSSANSVGGTATAASSPSATTLVKTSSTTFASTSSGQAAAASSSAGAGAVTAKSSSTQQILFTTTLPNGSQSTVTSFTIVPAGEQASTPGVSGSTMTGTPSLQNGAVDGTQPRGMGLIGSLVAALLFVVGIL